MQVAGALAGGEQPAVDVLLKRHGKRYSLDDAHEVKGGATWSRSTLKLHSESNGTGSSKTQPCIFLPVFLRSRIVQRHVLGSESCALLAHSQLLDKLVQENLLCLTGSEDIANTKVGHLLPAAATSIAARGW